MAKKKSKVVSTNQKGIPFVKEAVVFKRVGTALTVVVCERSAHEYDFYLVSRHRANLGEVHRLPVWMSHADLFDASDLLFEAWKFLKSR